MPRHALPALLALTAFALAAGCGDAPPPKAAEPKAAFAFSEEAFTPDHRGLDVRDLVVEGGRPVAVATNRGLFIDTGGGMRKADLPGAPGEVTCVRRDATGKWYAGTPDGLYESSTGQGAFLKHDLGHVTCLAEDADGRIWAGTKTGLKMLRGRDVTVLNKGNGMPHDEVICLARDTAEAALLAGTVQGVARVKAKEARVDKVFTGTAYVPLMTGGLSEQPGNTGMEGNTISRLLALDGGTLYVATNRGVNRTTTAFEPVKHYSADSDEPAKTKDGGLGYEKRKGNSPLLSNFVRALAPLAGGRIAIGVKAGISILDQASDTWTTVTKGDEGFPGGPVNVIRASGDGYFVGTGAGLFRYGPAR